MDNEDNEDTCECERCGRMVDKADMHFSGAVDAWRCEECTEWVE